MTQGTGKRSYRACLRCRQRKTRCNLDGVGESKKPPCVACYHSGSDCILVASRRGGRIRKQTVQDTRDSHAFGNTLHDAGEQGRDGLGPSSPEPSENGPDQTSSNEEAPMELRNPSDALQILAQSGEHDPAQPSDFHQPGPAHQPSNVTHASHFRGGSDPGRMFGHEAHARSSNRGGEFASAQTKTVFDEYELIRRGSLHPAMLPELLQIYLQEYHPYCPIVPHYMLKRAEIERIQKSDHFLLTVLLTIASRDSPEHSITHRTCWDHTQHLLSGVVLAHPWAQSPRTVQALLLLSEWLPHIQVKFTSTKATKTLFAEDRTAWSLVGLAVRQAYLLRLDQAAFCEAETDSFKEREEQKRIIWTFVYLTDRQISARLGQAFWSRGPSVSSQFTADDFPSLRPTPDVTSDDLAPVLQATIELIQILHNAHGILYSSAPRTLDMAHQGDYARYLDDFQRAASTWHATWSRVQVRKGIRNALLMMYEYLCLYVNAFAFQAVLTRSASPRARLGREQRAAKRTSLLFSRGIMSTWDGQYIFNAVNAARNLLNLMIDHDMQQKLCYLPSRYLIYGVYASVFLHKALYAEVLQSSNERQSIVDLALEFTSTMEQVPTVEPHVCHEYGRMLRNLWRRHEVKEPGRRTPSAHPAQQSVDEDLATLPANRPEVPKGNTSHRDQMHGSGAPWTTFDNLEPQFDPGSYDFGTGISPLRFEEGLFSGSFFPGITNFGQQDPSTLGFGDPWISGF